MLMHLLLTREYNPITRLDKVITPVNDVETPEAHREYNPAVGIDSMSSALATVGQTGHELQRQGS